MFDVDVFISECIAASEESQPQLAIRDVLRRAVSEPSAVEDALPPTTAELTPLYASDVLTVMKVVWAPSMALPPHDHRMWAAIGIYGGAEDNTFWRRRPGRGDHVPDDSVAGGEGPGGIVDAGGKSLVTSDVLLLGDDVVHSVTNPRARHYTGAIHIYGGAFMKVPRSMWDPVSMREGPADGESVQKLFAQAEAEAEHARRRGG